MKKILIILHVALFALGPFAGQTAIADSDQYNPSNVIEQNNNYLFTAEELDDLLAPIALYPDPLLAQILPAATYIEQIDLAARYIRQYGKSARISSQPWDVSVKALAHYPDVLNMMDQKYDWTVSLGQAYVNQQQDVMDAIQHLRAVAESEGHLASTPEQQVVNDGGFISIDPVEPDVIYVPQYDPLSVYLEGPSPDYGFITFGIGFSIGAWLNRDCDWSGHRIYYHGWQGGGWISRARPHIHDRNNVYVNSRNSIVSINTIVNKHNTLQFRENVRSNVQSHPERLGKTTTPKIDQIRPTPSGNWPQVRPDSMNVYRGRDIQKSQPSFQTGYGGYGSSKDAASYRERGQASRGNMQQITRPVPVQRPASQQVPRQATGGGRGRQR